jgi:hypothetical protein
MPAQRRTPRSTPAGGVLAHRARPRSVADLGRHTLDSGGVGIIVSPLRRRRNKRRPDGCLRERKPRISTSLRWNVFAGLPSLPVDQGPVGYDRPGGYSSFIRNCRGAEHAARSPHRLKFVVRGHPMRERVPSAASRDRTFRTISSWTGSPGCGPAPGETGNPSCNRSRVGFGRRPSPCLHRR